MYRTRVYVRTYVLVNLFPVWSLYVCSVLVKQLQTGPSVDGTTCWYVFHANLSICKQRLHVAFFILVFYSTATPDSD